MFVISNEHYLGVEEFVDDSFFFNFLENKSNFYFPKSIIQFMLIHHDSYLFLWKNQMNNLLFYVTLFKIIYCIKTQKFDKFKWFVGIWYI